MGHATVLKHRTDIDGLRALAVLPITLFHAGIPGFGGGFVGVDIFFVISGFLITTILDRDIVDRRFTYVDFYERRIRRIAPALACMLAATSLAAYFLVLPSELRDYGRTVIGAVLFASNIVFWMQTGYFDDSAIEKPLLHTWSLGVEEQFYILAPIALSLIIRWFPARKRLLLAALFLISLLLCVVLTRVRPNIAFYLIPTRAWELLAGSLVALALRPETVAALPARVREALAAAGVAMIVAAIALFTERTPFPGIAAALPVLGTVLVLGVAQGTAVDRLLSVRPLVFVGLISYSLYLWHWPLIVFARRLRWLDGTLPPALAVVAVSIAAGWLSYRLIETPFRDRVRFGRRRLFVVAGVSAAALLAVGGVYAASRDGLRGRGFDPRILAYDDGRKDFSPRRKDCHPSKGVADPAHACVFGGQVADTALWGDSHGVELAYALGNARHPLLSLTYSSCPPAVAYATRARPVCRQHNALVATYLQAHPEIRTIILTAYYLQWIDRPGFQDGMIASVRALQASGKRVFVVAPVPAEMGVNIPRYLVRGGARVIPRQAFLDYQARPLALMAKLQQAGATVLFPSAFLCDAATCRLTIGDHPVLFDKHHLSMTGARYLARPLGAAIWPQPQPSGGARPIAERK